MASTFHWGSVYRNANLLRIHFSKLKPPHIATPKVMYISTTFHLSIENFPLILAKNPIFPRSVGTLKVVNDPGARFNDDVLQKGDDRESGKPAVWSYEFKSRSFYIG